MRIIQSLKTVVSKTFQSLTAWIGGEATISRLLGTSLYRSSLPGSWSDNRLEYVNHYRHWVYVAVKTIATLCTKNSPEVLIPSDSTVVDARIKRKGNWVFKANEVDQEKFDRVENSHRLARLMANPNGPDTASSFWNEFWMFAELYDESFIWLVKDYAGIPCQMWVIPSSWVYPMNDNDGQIVSYYQVRPIGWSGEIVNFPAEDIIHYKGPNPYTKTRGYSKLQAGAEIIDAYEMVQRARFSSLRNGSNVGAVITLPDDVDANKDTIASIEAEWVAKFGGEFNFNRPVILSGGATIARNDAAQELAFLQSSDQLRDYILGLWGLSKSVIGFLDGVNRATFEGALSQVFYMQINPRLQAVSELMTEKVAVPYFGVDYLIAWPDGTPNDLEADVKKMAMKVQETGVLISNGAITRNELREKFGYPRIEGLDELLSPVGMAGISPLEGDEQGSKYDEIFAELMKRSKVELNGRHNAN